MVHSIGDDEGGSSQATPPSTSLERAAKAPKTGTSGTASTLQPGGVIPGGGPAGAGKDDMGKAKKKK